MDRLETDFLNTQEYLPLAWYRYIDNIFFIWTHGEEKLKFFLEDLNKYHPNINFIQQSNKEFINFLDLTVSLLDNKVSTDLYVKPTDRHHYLHHSSSHLDHTKKSIVYSQTLRLSMICSVETDLVRHKKEIKSWFLKRGYPENIINREMEKAKFKKQVFSRRGGATKGVPLVTTYHPLLKSVGTILYKHLWIKKLKRFSLLHP